MTAILRALTRPIKRLLRPLRLRYLDHKRDCSLREIARLRGFRGDLETLERNEHFYQVQLEVRRQEIERAS